jgi:SCY1-like protein 2
MPPPLFATPMAAAPTPPTMGMESGILQPSKPAQPAWGGGSKQLSKADWGDFDPLA